MSNWGNQRRCPYTRVWVSQLLKSDSLQWGRTRLNANGPLNRYSKLECHLEKIKVLEKGSDRADTQMISCVTTDRSGLLTPSAASMTSPVGFHARARCMHGMPVSQGRHPRGIGQSSYLARPPHADT